MKWKVSYFNKKVTDGLKSWPVRMRAKYLRIVELMEEHGPHLGEPITKPINNGLFEIRVKAKEGIGRAFFCYQIANEIVILHSYIKKSQKAPKKEIEIAYKRMKEICK